MNLKTHLLCNNTMFKCEFCNKILRSISSLNQHQKTTKYCLKIQNKVNDNFICLYCENIFTTKQALSKHLDICKEKKDDTKEEKIKTLEEKYLKNIEELHEKDIEIATLKAKIEIYEKDHDTISDIAKQTKVTTTNNIINNLAVYDTNKITENFSNKLENITKNDIINGQKGIANFLAPCLYDDLGNKMITCTDRSRLIFTKIDENNNKIKDSELKNLALLIQPLALKKADEIVEEHTKLKYTINNIDNLKLNNKDYESYIKHFEKLSNNYKISNTNKKLIKEYESKIEQYQSMIKENNKIINEYDYEIIEEDDEDRLLDGHSEIKALDKESSKFARHLSKII